LGGTEVSAIKKNEFEDKLVFRVYNPADKETTGNIKLGFDIHRFIWVSRTKVIGENCPITME